MNNKVKSIIILHGWGLSGKRYDKIASILRKEGLIVFAPDLPGFGKNKLQNKSLSLDDYSYFLRDYIIKNKIVNYVVIAHSFGGRVLINFIKRNNEFVRENRMLGIVLSGTPLIKKRLTVRQKIGKLLSIFGKKIVRDIINKDNNLIDKIRRIIYMTVGQWDYYKSLNTKMDKTLVNILKINHESFLKKIDIPTLILWGKEDKVTPYDDALKIHKLINNSVLVGIDHATHKVPYENPSRVSKEVKIFVDNL